MAAIFAATGTGAVIFCQAGRADENLLQFEESWVASRPLDLFVSELEMRIARFDGGVMNQAVAVDIGHVRKLAHCLLLGHGPQSEIMVVAELVYGGKAVKGGRVFAKATRPVRTPPAECEYPVFP